jgi:hypothetical protein
LPPYGLPRRLQPVFCQKRPPARIQPTVGVNDSRLSFYQESSFYA